MQNTNRPVLGYTRESDNSKARRESWLSRVHQALANQCSDLDSLTDNELLVLASESVTTEEYAELTKLYNLWKDNYDTYIELITVQGI